MGTEWYLARRDRKLFALGKGGKALICGAKPDGPAASPFPVPNLDELEGRVRAWCHREDDEPDTAETPARDSRFAEMLTAALADFFRGGAGGDFELISDDDDAFFDMLREGWGLVATRWWLSTPRYDAALARERDLLWRWRGRK